MQIYFNPLDTACKSKIGGVLRKEKIQFNVYLLNENEEYVTFNEKTGEFHAKAPLLQQCQQPQNDAFLRLTKDGEHAEFFSMEKTAFGWTITLSINEIGLYFYSFYIENKGNIVCGYMQMGDFSQAEDINSFLLTVSSEDYTTPEWFKGGVMYQIFPDRFCKIGSMPDIKYRIQRQDWGGTPSYRPNNKGKVLNNDFFGGNLKGILSKLPYLKSLGVTTIYLNPIFEAASNHRYDTSDYLKIDPFLGSEEDFTELVKAAENQGIRLILDGVFNHTGDNSVYFNKYGKYPSLGAYQSKNSPYYSWYSFQEFPDKYSSWWGIDILPEVNESSEEYQNFIFNKGGVLKKWLNLGASGYRLDVADELPDFFLEKLRKSVKEENPNAIIIGEVWEDASNKVAYSARRAYLQGYELDSVMNYPLKEAIISYMQTGNAAELLNSIRVLLDHYPKQTVDCLMNILGTHDTARILTVLGGIYCNNKEEMASKNAYLNENEKIIAIEKLKMAAVLQYTLPGVPCLYYGDENGMEGHIDPFCRRCFDWDNLNEDLIGFYSKLGELREKYKEIFKDGDFQDIIINESLICYKRTKNNQSIYIYANNSSSIYQLKLNGNYFNCLKNEKLKDKIIIEPNSFGILIKNDWQRLRIF